MEWAALHQAELQDDCERARAMKPLAPIDPLREVFRRFSDPAYFRMVRVNPELGTLCWPDGVDIAPETLHALAALNRVD